MTSSITSNTNQFTLTLSLDLYSLEAIKKTCYKYSDKYSILLDDINKDKNTVNVIFSMHNNNSSIDNEQLLSDFKIELLDQDLREIISSETKAIRNLILAQAFSKTSLLDE